MRLIFIPQDLWELVPEGYEQPPKNAPKSHLGIEQK